MTMPHMLFYGAVLDQEHESLSRPDHWDLGPEPVTVRVATIPIRIVKTHLG